MTTATPAPVFDHVAIGTRALSDGWELFGGLLGGTWAYGSDQPGFRWEQLRFNAGPKIELLTPNGDPRGAFLDRFLTGRDAGPHHFNFQVPDIRLTLDHLRRLGIEPVGVHLDRADWKEAFLHPRDAYGIVIQVAQSSGGPPASVPPAGVGTPGRPADFSLIEHHVDDLAGATRLFSEILGGQVDSSRPGPGAAALTWPGGVRLRLTEVPAIPPAAARTGGGLARLCFSRPGLPFGPQEQNRQQELARRLGISVLLTS
jgi:catechol 2,3-dioxygenase-like lactoylglutathione lyase family enzyme